MRVIAIILIVALVAICGFVTGGIFMTRSIADNHPDLYMEILMREKERRDA